MKFFKCVILCVLFQMLFASAHAQIFGEENVTSSFSAEPIKAKSLQEEQTQPKENDEQPSENAVPLVPEFAPKPSDRNAAGIAKYSINDQNQDDEMQGIFMYYRNFSVVHTLTGRTMCSLQFVLYSTLNEKISSLGIRINWPEIKTFINYNNVMPRKEYTEDQTFFGDGCYSMDKLPNLIVNRCRLKGRTQKECASLVRLTTEDKAPFKK